MYYQLKQYFAHLATENKALQAHTGYFAREIAQRSASYAGIPSPFLSIYDYSVGLEGEELSSLGQRQICFAVLFSDTPADDLEAQQQAIDQAEQIALQLLARIRWDSHQKRHFLYASFQKELTRIAPIEEPQAQLYGVEVELHLKTPCPLSVNPDHWHDRFLSC